MDIDLRLLKIRDGHDIYDMLQEIPKDENSYTNKCNGRSFEQYRKWTVLHRVYFAISKII